MQGIQKLFGSRVKELRDARGISQEALADICGLHRTYIGLIERGARNLSLVTVEVVAQGLEVPVAELFTGIPASGPPKGRAKVPAHEANDVTAHLEAIKQILLDAKLIDAKGYDGVLKAIRKKRGLGQ